MQKEIIEEKQKEIVDSILYAKRIQNTLLASEKEIAQRVKDSFIYFQPKDIVSGDFYWCASQGDLFYLAVCDSTGHGVPGAFMSLLNITFLNEAINEKKFVSTAEILNHVRGKLSYSAAYNPPVRVRNGESVVFPADKMPIGQGEKKQSFTEHEIDLEEGDIIYAYTDGYGDQFGGERGKKFKTSKLIELLVDLSIMDMNVQQNTLKNTFENWRGSQEQIDDVTLVGIKFK
jgi:serine phosphatase RsbU (regulator of sigma subunit)